MRRIIGFVLIASGAFVLVLGILMPLYAYPNLARIDRGGLTHSVAEGSGMTVFDPESVNDPDLPVERHDVNLVVNRTVKGITSAPEAKSHGNVTVWEIGLVIMDRDNPDPKKPVSVVEEKLCVNRQTGLASEPCSSEYVKDPGRAEEYQEFTGRHKGQLYKFPFATERKDYRYFDTTLRSAPVARYVKDDQVSGLNVYKFEQVISRTKIEDREIPGRLLGEPDKDTVIADRYYENRRVMWVEPETGVIVKGTEDIRTTLEDPSTGDSLTLLSGRIALTHDTIASNVDLASSGASKLHLLRVTAPWTLGIVGILLALVGVWLAVTGRRRPAHENVFVD